jgi:para-aminobenzoate synthetase component I
MPLRLLRHPLGGGFSAAEVFATLHDNHTDAFWLDSGVDGTSYVGSGTAWYPTLPVLDAVRTELAGPEPVADDDAPPFRLGLVGWLGYELRGETMDVPVARTSRYPDAAFLRVDRAVAVDPDGSAQLLALGDSWEEFAEWRDEVLSRLSSGDAAYRNPALGLDTRSALLDPLMVAWHETDAEYLANIAACQDAIREGEAYQLCLTTEASVAGEFDPVEVYARLRSQSPSHHGALLRIGGVSLLSSSPERFL